MLQNHYTLIEAEGFIIYMAGIFLSVNFVITEQSPRAAAAEKAPVPTVQQAAESVRFVPSGRETD